MSALRSLARLLALTVTFVACASESYDVGLDEPLVVQHAELKQGKLREGSEERATITSLQLNFGVLRTGAANVSLTGRASDDTYAVAIRFEDLGTGYWLKPVGAADPTLPDELTFDFAFQAASDIAPGNHTLIAAAFDRSGHPGPLYKVPVCVVSDLPDNRNACDDTREPPPAIVSLSWDADADLDLILEGPAGVRYDRSHRSELDGDTELWGLSLDGSTGCMADGRRRENFVFNELPEEGSTFLAYVSFFDACTKPAVRFTLTVYRARKGPGGTYRLVAEPSVRGEFVRAQQSGGLAAPLYLRAIAF
jgi:hypothetical protein